ncbi:MAG: hypothetical protein IJ088_07190 [Clostridia bacterium]|nr:hypothetical protein [Clostridia bacterium]
MKRMLCVLFLLAAGLIFAGMQGTPAEGIPFLYGDQQACDYYLNGVIPTFRRNLPISADDPNSENLPEDALIRYSYGYAFRDVNDYYFFNRVNEQWEGTEPSMDTGVMMGGNAYSKHDAIEQDNDSNDFASILPYASLYVDVSKLSYEDEGIIEYEFFSDEFNFNCSDGQIPENVIIRGENPVISRYQQKFPDLTYPRKVNNRYPVDWNGVIYTGGVRKTMRLSDGSFSETVVRNEMPDGSSKLFTVRYNDAVVDKTGRQYDLVLTFTQITFVAEADVTGAFEVLEANNLYVAPILYENGHYTVIINDPTNRVDVHDLDGVRIGARFEFDYSIESNDGVPAEGLVIYSFNDLDNASMATSLQTDANWGMNALGNDFRWAEGFGVVNGAASFAVTPYFNHEMEDVNKRIINNRNGDTTLLRISRMDEVSPDGTANGLYFTTSITSVSGTGARNDSGTLDTGVAVLLKPRGSMVASISSGRRGDVNITFFDSNVANKIEQSSSRGGRVYSLDHSFEKDGELVENTDFIKVVGCGATSVHHIVPDDRYLIRTIRIDGKNISYNDLKWTTNADGTNTAMYSILEEYGRSMGKAQYTFTKDSNGEVSIAFENVQDNHEIYVEFLRSGLFGMLYLMKSGMLIAVFLISAFALMMIIAVVAWMRGGKKKQLSDFD